MAPLATEVIELVVKGQDKVDSSLASVKGKLTDADKAVQSLTSRLKEQVETYGMNAEAVEIWRLKASGATAEQIKGVQSLLGKLKELKAATEANAAAEAKAAAAAQSAQAAKAAAIDRSIANSRSTSQNVSLSAADVARIPSGGGKIEEMIGGAAPAIAKLVAVGGAIKLLSDTIKQAANGTREFTRDVMKGEKSWDQLSQQFMDSLPVVGSATQATKAVTDAGLDFAAMLAKGVGASDGWVDFLTSEKTRLENAAVAAEKTTKAYEEMRHERERIRAIEDADELAAATTEAQKARVQNRHQLRDDLESIDQNPLLKDDFVAQQREKDQARERARRREAEIAKGEADRAAQAESEIRSIEAEIAAINAKTDAQAKLIQIEDQRARSVDSVRDDKSDSPEVRQAKIDAINARAVAEAAKVNADVAKAAADQQKASDDRVADLKSEARLLGETSDTGRDLLDLEQQRAKTVADILANEKLTAEQKAAQVGAVNELADAQKKAAADKPIADAVKAERDRQLVAQTGDDFADDRERIRGNLQGAGLDEQQIKQQLARLDAEREITKKLEAMRDTFNDIEASQKELRDSGKNNFERQADDLERAGGPAEAVSGLRAAGKQLRSADAMSKFSSTTSDAASFAANLQGSLLNSEGRAMADAMKTAIAAGLDPIKNAVEGGMMKVKVMNDPGPARF